MHFVFVVNPTSGKENAMHTVVPLLKQKADALGLAYDVVETKYAGHARDITKEYGETGTPTRIYACGGDGTLNEVFVGAASYNNIEVASLPCGSGNDFIRNFGTQQDFLNIEDALCGTAIAIDLVKANDGLSAAICSVGLDSKIAYNIPLFRRLPFCGGSTAYNLSVLKCLCEPIGLPLRVEIDGEIIEGEFLMATVCNGVAYGSGYYAAPHANVQDGILEVVLVRKISRLRIAKVLAVYKAGAHIENGAVKQDVQDIIACYHAKNVVITPMNGKKVVANVDGECHETNQLVAQVLPQSARFVLPQSVYERFAQTIEKQEQTA